MRKCLKCKGYPQVYVKSLDRTFKYDEHFHILEEQITPELESKIRMGLFEIVSGGIKSVAYKATDLFRNVANVSGRNTRKTEESRVEEKKSPDTSVLTADQIAAVVRETIKEELKNHNISTVSEAKVTRIKEKVAAQIDKTESVLFIRPDQVDIKGEVVVTGSAETDTAVDNAISKLKKKGTTNAKTSKGNSNE